MEAESRCEKCIMIMLDDEAKARELLAERGGYLVKANGKFHIMSSEEYTNHTNPLGL